MPTDAPMGPPVPGPVDGTDLFIFNGINGATGKYLTPPTSARDIAVMALSDRSIPTSPADRSVAAMHVRQLASRKNFSTIESFGVRYGVQPDRVDTAGWAAVFASNIGPRIVAALRPLLDLRKQQAGGKYFELTGAEGFQPAESKDAYLARHGQGPGPADKFPYYVMLVGDPEAIPYSIQYQFDVQYAVGRLWFDSVDEFAVYAQSVVNAETGKVKLARRAAVFAPQNDGDAATRLSATQLAVPLADSSFTYADANKPPEQWAIERSIGVDATHARLGEYLGGAKTPALLFTASHGMGFPKADARQVRQQGALLCQDWPGPNGGGLQRGNYFAAEDVPDSANLAGLISFHFACYGAGTPKLDDFAYQELRPPEAIADRAFVAALPQRLLAHPGGGALAVIGHVERAWGCSITWPAAGRQIAAFEDAMRVLMDGKPVGYAMETMNGRYADITSELAAELLEMRSGTKIVDDLTLATQWTSNNDARSYVVLGDPAARLPLANAKDGKMDRPQGGPIVLQTLPPEPEPEPVKMNDPRLPESDMTTMTPPVISTAPSKSSVGSVTLSFPLQLTLSVSLGDPTGAGVTIQAGQGIQAPSGGRDASFKVEIDPDYSDREGYDPAFLGSGDQTVPLPRLSPSQLGDAAVLSGETGGNRNELKYHHYSVVLNARRRIAFFTAVNIDGKTSGRPAREPDHWSYDPRVPKEVQMGEELYSSNPFDRGHLVRRLDPAWGRTPAVIKRANDDTFHFTNCSPQHKNFNQGKNLWAGLEDYLLNKATDEDKRMTVFTGPVFTTADPLYRDVRIPKKFWKVAVVSRPNRQVAALGFIVDQTDLLRSFISFDAAAVATTFQVPIERIEKLTGLNFGVLTQNDAGSVASFSPDETEERPLSAFEQIRLPSPATLTATSMRTAAFDASANNPALPPEMVPGSDLRYYLVAFDENGNERTDHPAGIISRLVDQAVTDPAVTDVMLFSHGWQGDVVSAREQYGGWIRAMASNDADRARMRQSRPGFKPVLIGIHWPSLAWGDERLTPNFSLNPVAEVGNTSLIDAIEIYIKRLGDSAEARDRVSGPLRKVIQLADTYAAAAPPALPPDLIAAYRELDSAVGLGSGGPAANPSSDRAGFDPDQIYQDAKGDAPQGGDSSVSFGGILSKDSLLAPLRALSFWKMKDRGRKIGEGAVHAMLVRLLQATGTTGRDVRFHVMGHSFGCVVATAAIAGAEGSNDLPRPVDSLSLIQGALSLWSYCANIPYLQGTQGYYHRLIAQHSVRGAIVTTRSKFDRAVGTWYPRAAQVAGAVAFGAGIQFPKYGGLGAFGIQGDDLGAANMKMLTAGGTYVLPPGSVTNVEASEFICNGSGFSGAHSDIRKVEVAHLVWSTMIG